MMTALRRASSAFIYIPLKTRFSLKFLGEIFGAWGAGRKRGSRLITLPLEWCRRKRARNVRHGPLEGEGYRGKIRRSMQVPVLLVHITARHLVAYRGLNLKIVCCQG
ncbi:hypothetical protein I312_101017 [Cryptococcus bacillisporus CA1280]|uniref:uncharacterized protein n=1 Tax=Cryptococcus bacillisporus CA1280 TaxID=1296109 RepID=UPI003365F74B